jgi:phytoene synthase
VIDSAALNRERLVEAARISIRHGSKSFATASRLLGRDVRERVWMLYAWCRACDDLADAQDHGGMLGDQGGADQRLAEIRRLTTLALAGRATGHDAFDCLGLVAAESGIGAVHTGDVIAGFALDTADGTPSASATCWPIATTWRAVGVVMALVMGVEREDADTLNRASDLGIAFQLGNIARDIAEDHAAGRIYLPAQWLEEAGIAPDLMAPRTARRWWRWWRVSAPWPAVTRPARASARPACPCAASGRCWPPPGSMAPSRARWRTRARAWDARVTTSKPEKLGC